MEHEQLKIIKRKYGIADRFSDGTIELHEGLDDFPELKKSIIQHEIHHTDNPNFNLMDLKHDLSTPDQVKFGLMLKFLFKHPSALVQFLPVYYTKKRGLIVDLNLFLIYGILLLISGGIASLAFFL